MKKIIFPIVILMMLSLATLNVHASKAPAVCKKQLTAKGFIPVCRNVLCSISNPVLQEICLQKEIYTPVTNVQCSNKKTRHVYQGSNSSDTFKGCMKRTLRDSNWDLTDCYCCCS